MSPYDIPASVVDEFVSQRLARCIGRLAPRTVNDIICVSTRRLLLLRDMGEKTFAEYRELRSCLIHDIDNFVHIAAERGLIDLREIVHEPNGRVSAPYKLIDPIHAPQIPETLRHVLRTQRVASLQDILSFTHVGYENRTRNMQLELAALKRTLLDSVQEHILTARDEGRSGEQEVLTSDVQMHMLRSAMLIDTVPLLPSGQLRSVLKGLHVSTLLELQKFWRIPKYFCYSLKAHQELEAYKGEVDRWLAQGQWTSLNFFPK